MSIETVESFENIYCAEQINVPVTFPHILKSFAKAAIRTQPYDLLRWTSAYFRALANNEIPPMKERFEYPPFTHPTGLTPRYLKTLLNQLGHTNNDTNTVTLKTLLNCWQGIVLSETVLYQILMIGHLLDDDKHYNIDLHRFLSVACSLLSNNLMETMIRVCELFTDEPDGGSAMIPLKTFLNIYGYLAKLNCPSKQWIESNEISLKNTEITLGNLKSKESHLFDNGKRIFSVNSISMEDLKSVCTYDETDESICELIYDESDSHSVTTTGENKTYDDNIKCQNSLSEDEMTVNEYKPLIDDKTSVKFIVMNEVTIVRDEIYNEIEEDFDNTVVVKEEEEEEEEEKEVEVEEHVMMNKDHNSPRDLVGSPITLDTSTTGNVTNKTSTTEFINETNKTNSSIIVNKSKMSSSQVGGDIEIVGEGKANITGVNEKLVEMVNEVEEVKKGRKHIVVNTMEKQKQQQHMKNCRGNFSKGLCKCHEESWRIKKINEAKTCLVELSEYDEKSLGNVSSCDKVTEFICKMKSTIHSSVNYDVVGIGPVVSDKCITNVGLWLTECALQQGGHVGPRNLRHFLCPSLYDVNNDDDDSVNSSHETETN